MPDGKVRISYQAYESEDAHLTVYPRCMGSQSLLGSR